MKTISSFVLIHGAWHASWCWQRIAKILSMKGHSVYTPDLPGHGLNFKPANSISLNDYVASTIELIKQQPEQVILVGHSMAGLIISQVAETIPDYIRELVYISAYIPKNGDSLFSIAEKSESNALNPYLIFDDIKKEIRLAPSPNLTKIFFNRCNKKDTEYAMARLKPEPLRPFIETVRLGENFTRIPKRAFVCKNDRVLVINDQLRMSKNITDNIIYLEADHAAYYSGASEIALALERGYLPCLVRY